MKLDKKELIELVETLKKSYPDATCSLDFSTPFELVVSVMLSAQCTDERVNKTTPAIFAKYSTPEDFANIDINELEDSFPVFLISSRSQSAYFRLPFRRNV